MPLPPPPPAHQDYASVDEFIAYGLKPEAWGTATQADVEAEIAAASDVMDGYFVSVFSLPLQSWRLDITRCCCIIAAYLLVVSPRGYNAGAGQDTNLRDRYNDMVRDEPDAELGWLVKVQRRAVHPIVVQATNNAPNLQQPVATSRGSVLNDLGQRSPRMSTRGW